VPAPDPSLLAHRPAPPRRPVRQPLWKSLAFRRTIIPILLTCGTLMLALGVMRWVPGPLTMWAAVMETSPWLAYVFLGIGAVLLALAALNMLQVKNQLASGAVSHTATGKAPASE